MVKIRVGNQSVNLIFDQYKLGVALIYFCSGGMPHLVGQLLTKGYNFALNLISIRGLHKKF
jgi:hypothetical protein